MEHQQRPAHISPRGFEMPMRAPTRIYLVPGCGILGEDGEHLEGGEHHTVTLGFARELVSSGRARYAPEADAPPAPPKEEPARAGKKEKK